MEHTLDNFVITIPEQMRESIARAAIDSGRPIQEEVLTRLEASFGQAISSAPCDRPAIHLSDTLAEIDRQG